MDTKRILEHLESNYPGCSIKQMKGEIVCELFRSNTLNVSSALAVIDQSEPHKHKVTKEFYVVQKGSLTLYVEDGEIQLKERDIYVIEPGQVHWAKGDSTHVLVVSSPPYSDRDHYLVELSSAAG